MNLQLGDITNEYPHGYGFCQCGCGKKTSILYTGVYCKYLGSRHHPANIAKREREKRIKERILKRQLRVEQGLSPPPFTNTTGVLGEILPGYELGWGICQCGCGEHTRIYQGKAVRYLPGHYSRTNEAREQFSRAGTELLKRRLSDDTLGLGSSVRGRYFSNVNGREMVFMSSYERRAFEILDVIDGIDSYEEQPFSISYIYDNAKAQYTPDIVVRFKDNQSAILEVKPRAKLSSPKVIAKAQAAVSFCETKGLHFMIWTEDFLRLQNYKRKIRTCISPLDKYCRLDYIENILRVNVEEIDRLLTMAIHSTHNNYHPRS